MRFGVILAPLLALFSTASAIRIIESDSLQNCGGSNETGITANLLQVRFTPDNNSISLNLNAISTINGNVIAKLVASVYGYNAITTTVNPCDNKQELAGLCPLTAAPLMWPEENIQVPSSVVSKIPGIAFTIPDLQASAQLVIYGNNNDTNQGKELACVQANLSNGKSVYQPAVGWVTAVIAGLGLLVSAVVSGLGHSNTAAHVAANAMSLFFFFQTQALFGMLAVPLPPIVASWTQNFQWSLGIIHTAAVQDIATWYQRSTGGTPSQLLTKLTTTSINVQKRSLDAVSGYVQPYVHTYMPRAAALMASPQMRDYFGAKVLRNSVAPHVKRAIMPIASAVSHFTKRAAQVDSTVTVKGIDRVGYRANIEDTNIFLTGYIFFIFFVMLVVICVVAFKFILEGIAKTGKMKPDTFQDFRNGWATVLKGILYRLILIGFPQMVVLCFWEFTVKDSAGEIALAAITIVTMLAMLGWVCAKVVLIARKSITIHKNPAYILYSDPLCLHKWGFLYVQFKAANYWFIIPQLVYILIFGMFVAFGQSNSTAQAIGLLIVNLGWLVALSIIRPYMDKKTNAFNISIAAINFVSSIFILFFTNIFGLPVSFSCTVLKFSPLTQDAGPRERYHGHSVLHRQRRLRARAAHPASCCKRLRHLLQEPGRAVPADARRPWLVHQVADEPQQRARRARSDCARREQDALRDARGRHRLVLIGLVRRAQGLPPGRGRQHGLRRFSIRGWPRPQLRQL